MSIYIVSWERSTLKRPMGVARVGQEAFSISRYCTRKLHSRIGRARSFRFNTSDPNASEPQDNAGILLSSIRLNVPKILEKYFYTRRMCITGEGARARALTLASEERRLSHDGTSATTAALSSGCNCAPWWTAARRMTLIASYCSLQSMVPWFGRCRFARARHDTASRTSRSG